MKPSEMKRDLLVQHPELGELRLALPVGPHRFRPDGTAVALVPEMAPVEILPSGAELLAAEAEGRTVEPKLSDDLLHTGAWADGDSCETWYAIDASWEQKIVAAESLTTK